MEGWSTSLSPEERALLVAALNKGSQGIRKAGGGTVQTTTSVKMEADFNLGQFIVELLLALEGVSAEVDEDGPTWVEEIDTGKT
jgi:hydroxymethylglutaryl-CoA reductase